MIHPIENCINNHTFPSDYSYRLIYSDPVYTQFLSNFVEGEPNQIPLLITSFGAIVYYEEFEQELLFSIFHPAEIFDFHLASSLDELETILKERNEKFSTHFLRKGTFNKCIDKLGLLDKDTVYACTTLSTGRSVSHTLYDAGAIEEIYEKQTIDVFLDKVLQHFNTQRSKESLFKDKFKTYSDEGEFENMDCNDVKAIYNGYNRLENIFGKKNIFENRKVSSYTNLRSLTVSNSFSGSDTTAITKFTKLTYISLRNSSIDKDLFKALNSLRNLVEIELEGYSYSLQTIKLAHLHNLTQLRRLKITSIAIETFSEKLTALVQLQKLQLKQIAATEIPQTINHLINLEYLDLSGNKWQHLPSELFELKNLKYLNLSSCALKELPVEILQLTKLEELYLEDNAFETLPDWINQLKSLTKLHIKHNHFKSLPPSMLHFKRGVVQLEPRTIALYDEKMLAKLKAKSKVVAFADLGLKLMVIQELMYNQQILLPKFSLDEFLKTAVERKVDIEKEGYDPIPEVLDYFSKFPIQEYLLEEITKLDPDGGDNIYMEISPYWSGEEEYYAVQSLKDIKYLKNLQSIGSLFFAEKSREKFIKQLEAKGISVD